MITLIKRILCRLRGHKGISLSNNGPHLQWCCKACGEEGVMKWKARGNGWYYPALTARPATITNIGDGVDIVGGTVNRIPPVRTEEKE